MSKENYRGIWVYIEQADHQAQHVGLELLHAARDLADTTGEELTAVILADDTTELVEQVKPYGADSILAVDCPQCAQYVTDVYTELLHGLICEYKPSAVLIGATENGRDFAPRVSCRLKTGLTADCTALGIDAESGDVAWTRPAFGGNLMATIICPRFRPAMATVRPGVMKKRECPKNVEIIEPKFELTAADIHTEVVDTVKAAKKLVDLIGADFIVSVGRGISKDVEGGIKLAEELAEVLGGVVGGSRATIDSGWLSADHQVGQTGKTVGPKLYVACGISGAIQHLAGMESSEFIIAINKDEACPMMKIADLGIVGDLKVIIPKLTEAVKAYTEAHKI